MGLKSSESMADGRGRVMAGNCVTPPSGANASFPRQGSLAYVVVKRLFDILFSAIICIIGFIPAAILCVVICADSPGNPMFRQERIGLHGRKIYIFKFRTMVVDAHEHPEKYMTSEQLEVWTREQKLDDDPRVTHIGRLLRRTSLDEIPQFINVLKGDLSVIGPRPVTESETYEFGDARDEILSCKPGITGWWQVTARNNATWENGERQRLELFYVHHASIRLDVQIFIKTFMAMGRGK